MTTVLVDVEESPQEHKIISTNSANNDFIIEIVLVGYTNKIPQKIMWKTIEGGYRRAFSRDKNGKNLTLF
jgi:hypothetical protein